MKVYTVHQAKTQLSKLIREALAGEDVVLANREVPVIRLTIFTPKKRKLGSFAGQGSIAADFDAPLADEFKEYL